MPLARVTSGERVTMGAAVNGPAGNAAPAQPRQATMADQSVLALVVLLLFQFPQPVVNGFDEDVQRRAAELERASPQPPDPGWGALLKAALQHWPFLAAAEVLLLPLGLWFRRRRAAVRQRAAARRAREEAARRSMEIERRRLLFKRRYKDMKEMWRTMKVMKKRIARFFT